MEHQNNTGDFIDRASQRIINLAVVGLAVYYVGRAILLVIIVCVACYFAISAQMERERNAEARRAFQESCKAEPMLPQCIEAAKAEYRKLHPVYKCSEFEPYPGEERYEEEMAEARKKEERKRFGSYSGQITYPCRYVHGS